MRHSKVRSSKPRSPGEIRASPILCLQVGQDGRSAIEMIITQHPTINDRGSEEFWSVRLPTLGQNFDASLASQEPRAVFERGGSLRPIGGVALCRSVQEAEINEASLWAQAASSRKARRFTPAGFFNWMVRLSLLRGSLYRASGTNLCEHRQHVEVVRGALDLITLDPDDLAGRHLDRLVRGRNGTCWCL